MTQDSERYGGHLVYDALDVVAVNLSVTDFPASRPSYYTNTICAT